MAKGIYQHKPMDEITKQKIRLALQGKPKSKLHIEKVRKANIGKKRSMDSRIKQSLRQTIHGISKDGYKRIYTIEYGRIKEHDYIMQSYLGRKLKKNEIVHHINGNKLDNRIDNLKLMHKKEHNRFHAIKNGLGKINHVAWNKGLTKESDSRIKKLTGRPKNAR